MSATVVRCRNLIYVAVPFSFAFIGFSWNAVCHATTTHLIEERR